MHPLATFALFVIISGVTADATCTTYAPVNKWDTCSSFAVTSGLHLHSLHKLNPSLDCSKRLPSKLCVADSNVDLPPTCGKWDEVQYDRHGNLDDGCTPLAVRNQISDLRYLLWLNPHLDCSSLVPGELVCIQGREETATRRQCINWEEVIGDGKTDPCAGRPADMNPHIRCGKPLGKGLSIMACSDFVEVPLMKATCTRHETFTVDGKTNYCQIKGGKDKMPELVKHLQLNEHLYCSAHGTVGGTVLLCMEGYVQTVEEDVSSPGSPTRDHLMLKLFDKLQSSPRLPSVDFSGGQDPFRGGARGQTTTHNFMHTAKKLPPGFSSTASGLIHLAGAAIRAYKAHGNQIMAQSAWGALVRAVALQDFSPDLFALQQTDPEFDDYVQHMFLTKKRDVTCPRLTSAARKEARLQAAARCFCDPQQHMMRCQTLLNMAMMAIQKDKPIPPPHPGATTSTKVGSHTAPSDENSNTGTTDLAAAGNMFKQAAAPGARTGQHMTPEQALKSLTPEEREVAEKIANALEMAAARAAGADPDAGIMTADELEKWHDSFKTPEQMRNLLQANTNSKTVVDEKILLATDAILAAKKEGCKKLQDLIKEGVEKLKKVVATCIVKYEGDICDDDGGCLSIQCPAADFQIVSINIKITICVAFPRDAWIKCRVACFALEKGYSDIGVPKKLNCPEACVRFLNDGYLNSKAEIQVDICLGGSALNLIKWLDDLVPDWVEDILGIKWEKLLCFTLIKGGLNFPTGLVYLSVLPLDLGIIKTSLDFTLQTYRPWHYPEICDCNASPWGCQPYCLKDPGGLTFSGYITVGFNIDLWLFELDLTKTWSWKVGFPPCGCAALPPKAGELCAKGKGIAPPSTTCGTCPGGMIAPNGGTCIACPAGSIPKTDRTNCLYCASGYIAANDGSTSCVKCGTGLSSFPTIGGRVCRGKCPPGQQLKPSATSCTKCPSGTYNPGRIINSATRSTGPCKKCPKGSVPNAAKTACTLCEPGFAATVEGLPTCGRCSAGYIPGGCQCKPYTFLNTLSMRAITGRALVRLKASAGGSSSSAKGAGAAVAFKPAFPIRWATSSLVSNFLRNKFPITPTGSAYVALSPAAKSLTVAGLLCAKNYGCKSCNICPPGTYSEPKDLTCTPCSPGYYQPKAGQRRCLVCPSGTAAPAYRSVKCTSCPAGTYSSGCRPKFVFETLPDLKVQTAVVGRGGRRLYQAYVDELPKLEGKMVMPDAEGHLQVLQGPSRTLQAVKKAYTLNTAFRFQLKFAIANVQPTLQGCTECAKCPLGTYSSKVNSTACFNCQPGSYQAQEGRPSCNLCPSGTQSAYIAAIKCHPCNQGNQTDCGGGKLCNSLGEGHTTCVACTKSNITAVPIKISAGAVVLNRTPGQCRVPCPAGWFRQPADIGTNETQPTPHACQPCPPGYVPRSTNTTTEQSSCAACAPGRYKSNYGPGICTLCPKNTYNPFSGQGLCIPCGPLFVTDRTGATSFKQCRLAIIFPG